MNLKYSYPKNKNNNNNIENKRYDRKKKLFKTLKDYKLEYKKNSICDIYIKYGMPKIDDVIDILEKNNLKNISNLTILTNELTKLNLKYNKKLPSHYNFIKNGGNINKTIEIGEIEEIIIDSTNYLNYLKTYSKDEALDIACIEYLDQNGKNKIISNYLDKILTLDFF